MLYEVYMSWSVADARARFSEVLHAAERAPQFVLSRGRTVAVIVDPGEYAAFESWRNKLPTRTLADALDHVQLACAEEGYALPEVVRQDRPNAFADDP